jgi:uncharacterized protein YecT (DUF1311 family)
MRISFPSLTVALLLTAGAPASSAPTEADACNSPNSNQAQMNDCYGAAYKKSDAALNELYREIQSRLKDDQATLKLLTSAEKAWLAFRDAECAFSTSGVSGGSIYPTVHAICLDELTRKRIDELKIYLKCQEGDMSCPVPAQ